MRFQILQTSKDKQAGYLRISINFNTILTYWPGNRVTTDWKKTALIHTVMFFTLQISDWCYTIWNDANIPHSINSKLNYHVENFICKKNEMKISKTTVVMILKTSWNGQKINWTTKKQKSKKNEPTWTAKKKRTQLIDIDRCV